MKSVVDDGTGHKLTWTCQGHTVDVIDGKQVDDNFKELSDKVAELAECLRGLVGASEPTLASVIAELKKRIGEVERRWEQRDKTPYPAWVADMRQRLAALEATKEDVERLSDRMDRQDDHIEEITGKQDSRIANIESDHLARLIDLEAAKPDKVEFMEGSCAVCGNPTLVGYGGAAPDFTRVVCRHCEAAKPGDGDTNSAILAGDGALNSNTGDVTMQK